ncbi:hypothetical protein JXB37_05430, partial [candidate division WOR-3 bacterium]|nr:hypothetical protein [candidate division WOR-3 bacterium]
MRRMAVLLTILTAFAFGYVLLSEDFNSDWTTGVPPAGWRIYHHSPPEGTDDWHREEPGSAAWPSRDSRFAALYWNLAADSAPDSLITPLIDCSGYHNIRLRVTTRFAHNDLNRYIARLYASLDGGITFSELVHDYEFERLDSTAQVFNLDNAANQASVVFAWVFDSTLQNIRWWCIDDVIVEGESIPQYDVACTRVLDPPSRLIPGNISPRARFVNIGAVDQANVPVVCELRDNLGTVIQTWADLIPFLAGLGGTADITFAPPEPVGLGRYSVWFWHEAADDSNRTNDTLARYFTVTYAEPKYYDSGSGHVYHDWPVGHYGWGAKFGATYPVFVESLQVYLRCPAPPFNRFQLAVVRNNGGAPGDMRYKTPVLSGTNGWNSVYVPQDDNHLQFGPADSFYVFYLQVGETQECPELSNDGASRPSYASYWQYRAGDFVPDTGTGNFRIRCWVNKETLGLADVDMRTLYVDQPRYELVQRPFDAPFAPRALIDNFGTTAVVDVPVTCSIFGAGNLLRYANEQTIATLGPGAEVFVEFDSFTPPVAEPCSVVVTVAQGSVLPEPLANNIKRFGFDVRKGVHTGMSSSGDYAWIDSDTAGGPVYDWVDTTGAGVAIAFGDEQRIFVPIGFPFPYGDSSYLNCYVSTNGWLKLGSDPGTNDSLPRPLPDAATPNGALYPWWDNFAFGPGFGGGKVFYRNLGEMPNRRFAVIWQDAWRVRSNGDTSELVSFEAVLHENGTVVYQYLDTDAGDPTFDNARNATIGLEDKLGSDGLGYLYARPPMSNAVNDLENRVRPGSAVRLYPIYRDAAALDITNPPVWTFPGSITPEAKIQNYGTVTDSIQVYFKIRDADPPYEDTVTVPGLLPGDSTLVSFSPWLAELGYYTLTCSVVMFGDVADSNDVVRKLVAVSPWIQRDDIPLGDSRRKVKGACLEYNPDANEVYAMKGGNENTVWRFDLAAGAWDSLTSMPLAPSGRRAKYGCDLAYDPDYGAAGRIWAMKAGGSADFYYYDIAAATWTNRKDIALKVFEYRAPKKGAAIAYAPENNSVYA